MSEAETVYVVYESVAQSHDTNRTDLVNESVVTFPVIEVHNTETEAAADADRVNGVEYTEAPADWF
jgi:hypothetical protein